jgi:hypothetical protein
MLKSKHLLIILFLALAWFIMPSAVSAYEVKTSDNIFINQGEEIQGNLYAAGNTISVDGTVKGDLICGAQTLNVNGKIEGDIICGAQTININGEVGGSIRTAGNTININNKVGRGIQALGASINVGKNASVGSDMFLAGASGLIQGKIGGDLHGAGASIIIDGEIAKNVRLRLDEGTGNKNNSEGPLKITDNAKIGGSVTYTSALAGSISNKATIANGAYHNLPKINHAKQMSFVAWFWKMLYSVFSALVIGLVLISLWPKQILSITENMLSKAGSSIGWGTIVLLLSPIVCLLLALTFIGLPLAFLIVIIWVIAIVISKVIVGILIGQIVLEKFWPKQKNSLIWAMIVGIIIVKFIFAIPLIGWMMALIAIFWGLGGLWLYFKNV